MSAEEEKAPWPVRYRSVFLAATLILTLISYGNSLQGGFVWDDILLIKDNPELRDPASLPRLFSSYFKLSPEEPTSFYRPLAMATYLLDYQLWGLNQLGYHLTNLLLHLLATFLVYLAGRKLFSETAALIMGLYDLAMKEYQKPLELNPKNTVTWFNLGRIYRMKGMHAEANRCFEEYRRLTQ